MFEKKVILRIWAAVIALLIGSMALAGFLASKRPEYVARPGLETCAAQHFSPAQSVPPLQFLP